MDTRPHPDLHKRLTIPAEARRHIEKFDWVAFGFPNGRPFSFSIDGRKYKTAMPMTDDDAVATALSLLLDFEVPIALEESMLEKWDQ